MSSLDQGVVAGAACGRPVGLFLRGRPGERELASAAVQLVAERQVERGLMVILIRPYVPRGVVIQTGSSVERYERELDLEARTRAIGLLEEIGPQARYSLFNVAGPGIRRAARLATELGCDAMFTAARRRLLFAFARGNRDPEPLVSLPYTSGRGTGRTRSANEGTRGEDG
jgi:hypothetical protein